MAKRQNRNKYVGNTPGLNLGKPKRRKASGSQYRVPKEVAQALKDKAYMEFQATPKLNKVTNDLRIKQKCDTIIGGDKIWLKGITKANEPYMFPIIVGGERCPNDASVVHRQNGKNHKRCRDHTLEEWWIDLKENPDPAELR
jgi:hypothetical protein